MALVVFQQFDPGSLYLERALGYETGMGLSQPVMYSTPGVQTSPPLPGGIRGVRFPKIVAGPTGTAGAAAGVMSGAQTLGAVFFLGVPITVTTGLTFVVQCTDDGTNPSDLGQTAIFGLQTKIITSTSYLNFGIPAYATTSPFLNVSTGTGANTTGAEVSNGVTLGLTAGLYASTSIQIANASFTANTVVMCKLRRVGMATTDTLAGSILVTGVAAGTY